MTIETKFNIGDKIWCRNLAGIFYGEISNIRIEVDCFAVHIYYELWNDIITEECNLSSTKEELLKLL